MTKSYSITSLSERALLVSFGNVIDEATNRKIIALKQLVNQNPFYGFIESVPAYSSLAVIFDVKRVRLKNPEYKTAFDFVKEFIEMNFEESESQHSNLKANNIEIPVLYDGEDLGFVSNLHKQTKEETITIHGSRAYQVFMIGFMPGFAYMGKLDERIATPRRSSPRAYVPVGSVGIAGFQTGIYPQASPGGWQLIGRTPLKVFDKAKVNPCLFAPGDNVRFYSIDKEEFIHLNEYCI